jgi:hypothetical protein
MIDTMQREYDEPWVPRMMILISPIDRSPIDPTFSGVRMGARATFPRSTSPEPADYAADIAVARMMYDVAGRLQAAAPLPDCPIVVHPELTAALRPSRDTMSQQEIQHWTAAAERVVVCLDRGISPRMLLWISFAAEQGKPIEWVTVAGQDVPPAHFPPAPPPAEAIRAWVQTVDPRALARVLSVDDAHYTGIDTPTAAAERVVDWLRACASPRHLRVEAGGAVVHDDHAEPAELRPAVDDDPDAPLLRGPGCEPAL